MPSKSSKWVGPGQPLTQEVETYIGLGSNLGDRQMNLANARKGLLDLGRVTAESSIYETEPWGVNGPQPDYLNQVVRLVTTMTPRKLLGSLLDIEAHLGRTRSAKRGEPRLIDLDLLLYGADCVDEPDLVVPHPRMHERPFVLAPLAEIAGRMLVPGTSKTVAELANAAGAKGVMKHPNKVKRQAR